jgi:hypothetical protein
MIKINSHAALSVCGLSKGGRVWRFIRVAAMGLLASLYCVAANADLHRNFYMGFTPWLYDFNPEAIASTYSYINSHSDLISHHLEEGVPWTEALENKDYSPSMMWEWNQRRTKSANALKVFVSISPLNQTRTGLADYRGALPHMGLPTTFAGKRLNDPVVKKAYLNYAESVIDYFEPDYLAITVEANELFFNSPQQWADFVELYIETYAALKLSHPELPVFFTTNLHMMNQMKKETDDVWSELSMLWNYSDIAALSYYPYMQYPLEMSDPVQILDRLREHTDKPLAISESGYPAEPIDFPGVSHIPASERLQGEMMFRILLQAYVDQYVFVVVWTHRDFDQLVTTLNLPAISNLWRDIGLLSENGTERLSARVWDAFYNLPMN